MRETNKQRRLPRFSPHSQHFSAPVWQNFLCKGWVETRLTPRKKKKSDFNSLGLRRTVTVNELTAACVCVYVWRRLSLLLIRRPTIQSGKASAHVHGHTLEICPGGLEVIGHYWCWVTRRCSGCGFESQAWVLSVLMFSPCLPGFSGSSRGPEICTWRKLGTWKWLKWLCVFQCRSVINRPTFSIWQLGLQPPTPQPPTTLSAGESGSGNEWMTWRDDSRTELQSVQPFVFVRQWFPHRAADVHVATSRGRRPGSSHPSPSACRCGTMSCPHVRGGQSEKRRGGADVCCGEAADRRRFTACLRSCQPTLELARGGGALKVIWIFIAAFQSR